MVVFFISINNIKAQKAYYFGPEIEATQNDTILFNLKNYVGNVQWQRSYNSEDWHDIIGETSGILLYEADSSVYVRAKVTAGNCPEYFSDTKYMTVSKLNKNAFNVDSTDLLLISDSLDIEHGIYVYQGKDAHMVDTGLILIGSKGAGYMRKVKQVNFDTNIATVETEQATIEDVYEYLDFTDSIKMLMSSDKEAIIGGVPVPVEVLYMIPGAKHTKGGIVFGDEVSFFASIEDDETGEAGKISLTLSEGYLNFEPALIRSIKVGLFKIKKVKIALRGTIEHNLEMKLSCSVSKTYSKEFKIAKYRVGPYFCGVVPMFIEYSITAVFSSGFGVNGSIEMGYKSNISTTVGAEYNCKNDPKWNTIWETNAGFDPHIEKPAFGFNAETGFSIIPEAYVEIAGTQGPYINLEPYLKGGFEVSGLNWEFAVKSGIDANLGYKVKIFGKKIANFNTNLPIAEWTLYKVDGKNKLVPPSPVNNKTPRNISHNLATLGGYCETMVGSNTPERGVYYGTTTNPHEGKGIKVPMGEGDGYFDMTVYDLSQNTTYYVRAYAENDAGITFAQSDLTFKTDIPHYESGQNLIDIDGNSYKTVIIGNQTWMAENLKVTKYQNGNSIEFANGDYQTWNNSTTGVYDYYERSPELGNLYGAHYNWYAVTDSRNVCPAGYKIPSADDWKALALYLGAVPYNTSYEDNNITAMLKSTATFPKTHPRWDEPNIANNITGFSALPAGMIWNSYSHHLGILSYMWSSSLTDETYPSPRIYQFTNSSTHLYGNATASKSNGLSVRCVKINK
ncbi:MAG: fibrobacter succinogenes major paralogous domain-containing protein [Bacteroidetes bacterium]|nr:fibrobacter succinogenes major paralogous domain-containing protein [Bacteroidota bacterium]